MVSFSQFISAVKHEDSDEWCGAQTKSVFLPAPRKLLAHSLFSHLPQAAIQMIYGKNKPRVRHRRASITFFAISSLFFRRRRNLVARLRPLDAFLVEAGPLTDRHIKWIKAIARIIFQASPSMRVNSGWICGYIEDLHRRRRK